jgi:hypothetical protein
MVTYRQVGRGMVRTMRAMDREAKRAERQRMAYEKAALKQDMLETAAAAVQDYNQLIFRLTGAHRMALSPTDWTRIANASEAAPPQADDTHERRAQAALEAYEPGWLARTLGGEARTRKKLEFDVEVGRTADRRRHEDRFVVFERRNAEIARAKKILELDQETVVELLDEKSQLGNLPFSIEGIDILFTDDNRVIAVVDGLDLEDMPEQSLTLLQSGKASVKALPRSKVLDLHRLNICSSAIRVALEFLNLLPLAALEVVMVTDVLDRGTGHIEALPVLYVKVAAQALASVNLTRAEADALIERLGGHFEFSRKDGFRPLNLTPFAIPIDQEA